MSCSNGTSASRHSLSLLLRWRQPQPRNQGNREENREERPQLARLPHLTRPRHLTWRPHLARRPPHTHLRRTSQCLGPRRTSQRRTCRRSAQRASSLPVRPAARPLRRWRGTRRRRELRLRRSNNRKPQAAMSVAVGRGLPSPARATMWRVHPRRRAQQRRWAPRRRALRQQRTPLTSDATLPSNKMRRSPISWAARLRRPPERPATPEPSPAECCATRLLPIYPPRAIPARAPWQARRSKAGSSIRNGDDIVLSRQ